MRTKIILIILLITIALSCQKRMERNASLKTKADNPNNQQATSNKEQNLEKGNFEMPHIEVIDAKSPISLELINLKDENRIMQISDGKISGIEEEIKKYYLEECDGNKASQYSMKDIYLNTIQIDNPSNFILYWVIFKHTSGRINSKVLFFDNTKKEFLGYIHDFNIHALYNAKDKKLQPSNLKEDLKLKFPEIEMIDFDGDRYVDFRFKRLYHNGTANAIEETIIEIKNDNVDTLKFEREWIKN